MNDDALALLIGIPLCAVVLYFLFRNVDLGSLITSARSPSSEILKALIYIALILFMLAAAGLLFWRAFGLA